MTISFESVMRLARHLLYECGGGDLPLVYCAVIAAWLKDYNIEVGPKPKANRPNIADGPDRAGDS